MDELLIKQLLNETTSEENEEVNAWRAGSREHEKYYQDFKTIWDASKNLQSETEIDEHEAWKRFKERTAITEKPDGLLFVPVKKRLNWMKVAAVLVIIAGGAFTMNVMFGNKKITLASANEVLIDTLPDGSVITLNKHSSLAYSKDFNEKTRNVELNGEAFFNVAPNKQKPFDIKVGNINVHVVGTSFNIKQDSVETAVIVETGIVKVSIEKDSIRLQPKEKVVIRKNNNKMQVEKNNDLLYNYYRTKTFECYNTPLHELIDALNKAYDVQIIIANEKTGNLLYTTTFKDMPLNNILNVITRTFNLSIEQKDGKIILK
jgi:ferric-dicitrate binding protein FerR (iron transport regulator)